MRTWARAKGPLSCGAVYGCTIATGAPYLQLRGDGWLKVRCAVHAGHPVPDDLDTAPPAVPRSLSFTRTADLVGTVPARVLYDVKQRQIGEA